MTNPNGLTMTPSRQRVLVAGLRKAYGHAATEPAKTREAIEFLLEFFNRAGVLSDEDAVVPERYEDREVSE